MKKMQEKNSAFEIIFDEDVIKYFKRLESWFEKRNIQINLIC